jgi:hypothetical protein
LTTMAPITIPNCNKTTSSSATIPSSNKTTSTSTITIVYTVTAKPSTCGAQYPWRKYPSIADMLKCATNADCRTSEACAVNTCCGHGGGMRGDCSYCLRC